jgi:uncharacterized SAM-binding protein YcdF (DUF218 family)
MADAPSENSYSDKPAAQASPWRPCPRKLLAGLCIGVMAGFALSQCIPGNPQFWPALGAVAGLVLGWLRLWRTVWAIGAVTTLGILVIAYTPLVPWLVSSPPATDALEPADAVVALGAGVLSDGALGCHSRDRSLHALELLREGYAKELVLPVAPPESWAPAVHEQMSRLGMSYPVDEPGPVRNTHDESMVVAALARQRGWRRVILVTNAWHMHRAAATFAKAGVNVLRSPCGDSCADMIHPANLGDRLRALGCWLHEAVGYRFYRLRGWAD